MNNRNRANKILVIVVILFIAATVLKFCVKSNFFIEFISFTLEAALVGGIADWFAVTALFRKPLGFSWHTAIIPNNREIIVEKVAELVEKELISADAITEKLSLIDPVDIILEKVADIVNQAFIEKQLSYFASDKSEELDYDKLSLTIDTFIKDNLKKEGIAVEIRNALNNAISHGNHIDWLLKLVKKACAIAKTPQTREKIFKVLSEQEKYSEEAAGNVTAFFIKTMMNVSKSSEHTNLKAISGILQSELAGMLEQMSSESDPVFLKLRCKFEDLVNDLDSDESLSNAIQTWKNGIIDRIDLVENLNTIFSAVVQSQLERNEASAFITNQLNLYRENLRQNEAMKKMTDEVVRTMLGKIIVNEHYLISEIVKETLGAFKPERLNKLIEDIAGEDLQWIRINGSIVGAAAGALIFLFAGLLYRPYIVPALQRLLGI